MDILDIDEALKNDSFIFLEDKTHDDVSNILQQWKTNNNLLPPQSPQQQHQQTQEHVYKINSKTFTRPRKKSSQNLESQFCNASHTNGLHNYQKMQQQNGTPILNLEIGGLVTTMHKSFLQDTSPPSSICSSMDVSVERMNNSLITSADFTNITFLQSTQSLDFNDSNGIFNLANKATSDGYTLSDMIRDRQALESLTMSGDGTLIKDTEISQIDDISLMYSKTASGCSTMDNSTESVESNSRMAEIAKNESTLERPKLDSTQNICDTNENTLDRRLVLSNEMIGDTTFNLVENTICEGVAITPKEEVPINVPLDFNVTLDLNSDGQSPVLDPFKKPPALDQTVCLSTLGNCTFDCPQVAANVLCETPENVNRSETTARIYESTPQTSNVHHNNNQQYKISLEMAEDVNISPIVAPDLQLRASRRLDETYEQKQADKSKVNRDISDASLGNFDGIEEMVETVENANGTYSKDNNHTRRAQQNVAGIEMQSVMDLAQAEAELLAGNDEEEFEHLLDEFSKVELNAEQLKMKQSLDTIKKRFNCNLISERNEQDFQLLPNDAEVLANNSSKLPMDESNAVRSFNHTMEIRNEDLRKLKESMRDSIRESRERELKANLGKDLPNNELKLPTSTLTSSAIQGERLLIRRSRLYDDINISTFSMDEKSPPSAEEGLYSTNKPKHIPQKTEICRTELNVNTTTPEQLHGKKTELSEISETEIASNPKTDTGMYKLTEKRERDRDRFKTIKICRQRTGEENESEQGSELNVPCIDDDESCVDPKREFHVEDTPQQMQRFSRRDHVTTVRSKEIEEFDVKNIQSTTKLGINYLTYKKSKDKQLPKHCLQKMTSAGNDALGDAAMPLTITAANAKTRSVGARSLSRPRFLSGIQRISIVSKATSASDLERTHTAALANSREMNYAANVDIKNRGSNFGTTATANLNRTQPNAGTTAKNVDELKSPMGIKSKSFHNLSSNFGYSNGLSASSAVLKRPSTSGVLIEKQPKVNSLRMNANSPAPAVSNRCSTQQPQKSDDALFKVPRLVSGIRAPSAIGGKRPLSVRPSSGYYSLNVNAKPACHIHDADSDPGRHSPTDSMSSASSRNSAQSGRSALKTLPHSSTAELSAPTVMLTKITTGSTGIPKPSGLKQPSHIKRSGLPRAENIVRR